MRDSVRPVIPALLFGNFVIGSGVMMVPGMLVSLANDLGVSVPVAGQLTGLPGLVMAIGAPLLAGLTSAFDRRLLLFSSLLFFAAGHLACMLSGTFDTLLWARCLAVLAPAVFTPQAAATISLLVPAERRSMAVTLIFFGWSLASVLGMPLANLLASAYGWRFVFGLSASLSLVAAVWVLWVTPSGLRVQRVSWLTWREALRHPAMRLIVLVTLLSSSGQFVLTAFLAANLGHLLGLESTLVAGNMFLFGLFGLAGSVWITRTITRTGPHRAVDRLLPGMCLGIACWCLLPWSGAYLIAVLAAGQIVWGFCCFSSNSGQQARLILAAPALASVGIALNSSAMYIGHAVGSSLGAFTITHSGYSALAFVALAIMLVATFISRIASLQRSP
jgi:predicted MFS family arabinose efflux permease